MGNIVLLDELTINKIAAGEVIERPASVVKELVENSIDAGATNILVEIQNGGISYIKIVDNGKGIAADDLEIAFERHATSKIRVADDLETVKSMGFRGEALASIAAISNVEMTSKTKDSDIGNKIIVEGGKILEKQETAAKDGTVIIVKNLFFNTPVRYKFLKKDFTEAGYIEDTVTRLALINPNISIRLISSGKTVIQTNGDGNIKNVIYGIYGKDVANGIIETNYEYENEIKVSGVIGKPDISRSNKSNQLFFVNKRFIKDKLLSSAVEQAYKGLLPIGKFGFCILNIELDPKKVDVNVHPAKLEVRFEEENKVFKAIYHAIKNGLLKEDFSKKEDIVPNVKLDITEQKENEKETEEIEKRTQNTFSKFFNRFSKKEHEEENEKENLIADIFNNKNINIAQTPVELEQNTVKDESIINNNEIRVQNDTIIPNVNIVQNSESTTPKFEEKSSIANIEKQIATTTITPENTQENNHEFFETMYEKTFGMKPSVNIRLQQKEEPSSIHPTFVKEDNLSVFEQSETYEKINYKYIGIAFSTYIIIEIKNDIYIIDQHAAHERIMYEKVKKNFYSDDKKDSQIMLIPDVITLSHKETEIVKENVDLFEKAGFTIEEFGDNTIKLMGVPNILIDLNTKQVFLDILDEIDTVARTARQEKEEKFIATVACKAAVKANMSLTKEEVDNLMAQLLKLPNPFTCPHGRPTAIKIGKEELEKKFSRR